MKLVSWDKLPEEMRTEEVRPYYDELNKQRWKFHIKRCFDIIVSSFMLILASPAFLILAFAIKLDSRGPVFFRQERITQYGRTFRIFKFRTMADKSNQVGQAVTKDNDERITRVGNVIRKYRLDEISQLIDVLRGAMTFVGTRPEVPKFVNHYSAEMMATLLLPAGVTSTASIFYRDESTILGSTDDVEDTYRNKVLPEKMKYNLSDLRNFSLTRDLRIMAQTVRAVFGG